MPRIFRGRPRGRHRRPKTTHFPVVVGSLAIAAATGGGLAVGINAASAGSAETSDALVAEAPPALRAADLATARKLRSQEITERSSQREQLERSAAAVEAQRAAAARATADAAATSRLAPSVDPEPVWVVPVQGYRLSSTFGPRWGTRHNGLDLAADSGTPILAMTDGEILSAQYEGGYGNKTVLRHADGTETWYCHQSGFAVRSGHVTAGQVIGYVGSTGNSTGPHLHLEVHPGGGNPIDPLTWMRETLGLDI